MNNSARSTHYGPRHSMKRVDARHREHQVREKAEETFDLLCQLRDYVETTLQPQLDRTLAERDELALEVDRLDVTNEELADKLRIAEERISTLSISNKEYNSNFGRRMDQLQEEHRERLKVVDEKHRLELQQKDERIKALEKIVRELEGEEQLDSRNRHRIDELERLLRDRQQEILDLNDKLTQRQQRLSETETRAVEVAPVISAVTKILSELKALVDEAANQSANFASAVSRAGLDSSTANSNAWNSLQASFNRLKEGVPVRTLLDEMQVLCVGLRSASRQENSFFAGTLRQLVLRHQEATELLSKKDHERQLEKDLARKRLEEVEKDRYEEREMLLKQIEREKMKSSLQIGASGAANSGGAGATSTSKKADTKAMSTVSSQTGLELLESLAPTTGTETSIVTRLRNEGRALNAQILDLKQTVKAMERQRQKFMGFVGSDSPAPGSISSLVQHALNGSSADFAFSGPLFAFPAANIR